MATKKRTVRKDGHGPFIIFEEQVWRPATEVGRSVKARPIVGEHVTVNTPVTGFDEWLEITHGAIFKTKWFSHGLNVGARNDRAGLFAFDAAAQVRADAMYRGTSAAADRPTKHPEILKHPEIHPPLQTTRDRVGGYPYTSSVPPMPQVPSVNGVPTSDYMRDRRAPSHGQYASGYVEMTPFERETLQVLVTTISEVNGTMAQLVGQNVVNSLPALGHTRTAMLALSTRAQALLDKPRPTLEDEIAATQRAIYDMENDSHPMRFGPELAKKRAYLDGLKVAQSLQAPASFVSVSGPTAVTNGNAGTAGKA